MFVIVESQGGGKQGCECLGAEKHGSLMIFINKCLITKGYKIDFNHI
jgi:hypothetical protein